MNFDCVLFDGDGVLYIEGKVQKYAPEIIDLLKQQGKKYALVTNNSTKTKRQYHQRLINMGIPMNLDRIFTSAYVASDFLKGETVYVIGEEGLFDACHSKGFVVVNETGEKADNVIIGMDRTFNYNKIAEAMGHILNGSFFIGTNPDRNFPSKEGLIPGAGSMIAAVEAAAERTANIIVGKPFPYLYKSALQHLGAEAKKTLMVGDRLETDILGAINMGMESCLVQTGIGSRYSQNEIDEFRHTHGGPDYVFPTLFEFYQFLKENS